MSTCGSMQPPPRRVVVRLDKGVTAPPELRRMVPEKTLSTLFARAAHPCKAVRPIQDLVDDLRSTHVVVVPHGADPHGFAGAIGSWKGAREVYLLPELELPPMLREGSDDPKCEPTHVPPSVKGARGRGVSFVDVEWGWAEHEALPRIEQVYGDRRGWWWHGNAVLGIIVGRDRRARGIAPKANAMFASPWTADGGYDVALALASAAAHLDPGDVLVVELQTTCGAATGLPVEVDPVVADVIALARHAGILTVEAAGNGGWNLDEVCVSGRGPGTVGASGAVLVGSGLPGDKVERDPASCWGKAVGCWAWGDEVSTAWSNHVGTARNAYNPSFSGTSAATAIVAGIAIAAQSAAKRRGRIVLPDEMRERLVAHGTPLDGVGVMPDLEAMVQDLG